MNRFLALRRFYDILDDLERRIGGRRRLAETLRAGDWPDRGVYFFFEPGETRSESGEGSRVVRVGTHALKRGARSTLRGRLGQHQGVLAHGGGYHRASIFRGLVGDALIERVPAAGGTTWRIRRVRGSEARRVRELELPLERLVSQHIRAMPLLFLPVGDAPGPDSLRGFVERNAIALLSGTRRPSPDPPSAGWLGAHSTRERVRRSGLWNNNHVDAPVDPRFLETLGDLVARTDSFES